MTIETRQTYYTDPGPFTEPGRHRAELAALPDDLPSLAAAIPGLLVHEWWLPRYGVNEPSAARLDDSHLRPVERLIDAILRLDPRPLNVPRQPNQRAIGVCRHFSLLLTAALRAKRIPARTRVGFGTYFNPGYFEDHWLTEYWDFERARWVRVDCQLDPLQRELLGIDFSPLDVPSDRFLVAGDAWARVRSGASDPMRFGIGDAVPRGAWFIAGALVRDLAALTKHELLAWDCWGAMPDPEPELTPEQGAFFDRLAALSREPDGRFAELHALATGDDRLRVPARVRNARRERDESSECAAPG